MSTTSEETGPQRYRVRAPWVTVRVPRGPNDPAAGMQSAGTPWFIVQLGSGAWLPGDTHPDDIARLLRRRIDTGPLACRGPMIEPVT